MRWTDEDFTLSAAPSGRGGNLGGAGCDKKDVSQSPSQRASVPKFVAAQFHAPKKSEMVSHGKKHKCQQLLERVCVCACVRVQPSERRATDAADTEPCFRIDPLRGRALHQKFGIDYRDYEMHGPHQTLWPYVRVKSLRPPRARTHRVVLQFL